MSDPTTSPPVATTPPSPLTEDGVAELCFTARALAQTHPMTERSLRYRQSCFEQERARQPVPELADWASTALLVGYCLRRAEEQLVPSPVNADEGRTGDRMDGDVLADRASAIADELRSGDADQVTLLPSVSLVAALDRIIGTELDKRRDHLREQLDDDAWSELEVYISWWAVHGYGVRASETETTHR